MLNAPLVLGTAAAYLGLLFVIAWWADQRAAAGRSVIGNAWVYALSLAVYCTAWTYFGSVGRAAVGGMWFLPIYFGPTLGMVLAWLVLRKMVRIAKTYRITTIADFISSRYGKSPVLAGLVTLITVVGIVPYIALQLKAISVGYGLLVAAPLGAVQAAASITAQPWWQDGTLMVALLMAGFTMVFGTRHLDSSERHEGMVAAIAFESVVKLLAFLAVGLFVCFSLYDSPAALFARARETPELRALMTLGQGSAGAHGQVASSQWFALTLLAMLSVLLLPRQFQVMVVENVDERHIKRAVWAFPLYLLLINLFVLPIALAGLMQGSLLPGNADGFVISLPLASGQPLLAMAAFIGGLSAATGMVIVESIAVSTMVCNHLVMPLLLRSRRFGARTGLAGPAADLRGLLLLIRRVAIAAILLLGYLYFRLAGEAYALVAIGLISFAAVAQFAPALLGGLYWKGGTRSGALAGLLAGFGLWAYTLMLPSLAKSGWLPASFVSGGPAGLGWLRPEQLLGLSGMDNLTHSLFWSLLANMGAFVLVSLLRLPTAREASQALLFVDVFKRSSLDAAATAPVFWRGRAQLPDLLALASRFLGPARAQMAFEQAARERGLAKAELIQPDARMVHFVETQLAGVIGSASARVMVARTVDEEPLDLGDVLQILEEASQLRIYAQALEQKSMSLQRATEELSQANQQLTSLDLLKDDFINTVTHELRTPLTSIRALSELMADAPDMAPEQRQKFLAIVVAETERLSRLVNQVLDMAKLDSGNADWRSDEVDMRELLERAAMTTAELFHARGAQLELDLPAQVPPLRADQDRLMQVVLNLLGNAVKFVPEQGGQVKLRLRADEQGLTVQVQDNGPGVPPAQQASVFERFQQGGDAAQRPHGTGLGLPISRRIIEHFGGRIWLQSDPGQGACFVFTLPWPDPAPARQDGGVAAKPPTAGPTA